MKKIIIMKDINNHPKTLCPSNIVAVNHCSTIYVRHYILMILALSLVSIFVAADDLCVDPDVANPLLTATTATYGTDTYSDICSGLQLKEATCNADDEGNPFLDYSLYDCPDGTNCVEGACITITSTKETNCGDGVTNDVDDLVDCADVNDCAEGVSCGMGKKCSSALCVFDTIEGNYNGIGNIDKEDIQMIKSNPAVFWNDVGKSVQNLNKYIKKMVDNWNK